MPRLVGSLVILSGRTDLYTGQAYANRHQSQIAQFQGLLFHPGRGTLVRGNATFAPDLISTLWEEEALMSFTKACPSLWWPMPCQGHGCFAQ
jgi:hypothetical protein